MMTRQVIQKIYFPETQRLLLKHVETPYYDISTKFYLQYKYYNTLLR